MAHLVPLNTISSQKAETLELDISVSGWFAVLAEFLKPSQLVVLHMIFKMDKKIATSLSI